MLTAPLAAEHPRLSQRPRIRPDLLWGRVCSVSSDSLAWLQHSPGIFLRLVRHPQLPAGRRWIKMMENSFMDSSSGPRVPNAATVVRHT